MTQIGQPKAGYDLVIATDGSCSGNPGPGGWAWVEQYSGRSAAGGSPQTTNNIMELTAMISALEFAGPEGDILLRSDSSYVIKSMTQWAPGWRRRGWKKADGKPVLNRDLIERMVNLYEARTGRTDIEWVRGHSGDAANELADRLAVEQTSLHAREAAAHAQQFHTT
ncbi:ribonuclease H [Trueperella pyogenes]|uniref:ribonuclease H family protein n=2 Tax=Trueperella pyogenes TaxID=1661 RepID=UPI00312B8421